MSKHYLTLTNRHCKIGNSINTRAEKHGDEDVPACDIPLDGILLEREELNALLGDKAAHKSLFQYTKNAPDEPSFKAFKPFALKDKFEECSVTLLLGISEMELELTGVKLANIKLEPLTGGQTALSLQVQTTCPVESMAQAIAFLNAEIEAEITFGKKTEKSTKQRELPMTIGNGEASEAEQPATH